MRALSQPQSPSCRQMPGRQSPLSYDSSQPQTQDWPQQRRAPSPVLERPGSLTSAASPAQTFFDAGPSAPGAYEQRSQDGPSRANSRNDHRQMAHLPNHNASSSLGATSVSEPPPLPPQEPLDSKELSDELPPLQVQGNLDESDKLEPLQEDDPASYELVAPAAGGRQAYSLETRSQLLFSPDHLQVIFSDPTLLLKFTAFLSTHRPRSVPILIYYLDALKAIRAINYSNAIAEALEPIDGHDFTSEPARSTTNSILEQKANNAFDVLVSEDLPAYITHLYIQIVSVSVAKRITGTLAPHLRDASEGLAEVFCLTDPSRSDNPIVFASEEFHRTTQYGMSYVLGRNCRFLQGPWTNSLSVRRIREAIEAGKEHREVFLNYRRDGSPFMNLLMCAPLCDSLGNIRYFIGAQVDVSGLVKECTEMESMQRLLMEHQQRGEGEDETYNYREKKDEFQELSEMLNMGELATVRKCGGRMHRETQDDYDERPSASSHRPRLLLKEPTDANEPLKSRSRGSGRLSGVYQHYLLVRPYPSLRILFASSSQRVPGILQSPFLNKIGGSNGVREELTAALAEGRGVTANVRWISKSDEDGRNKWIHCTPLIGSNGQIGVWMVVIVDDEKDPAKRYRQAPPVKPINQRFREERGMNRDDSLNGDNFMYGINGTKWNARMNGHGAHGYSSREGSLLDNSQRSESPNSLRIG